MKYDEKIMLQKNLYVCISDCDETSQINKINIFLHSVNYKINYHHDDA